MMQEATSTWTRTRTWTPLVARVVASCVECFGFGFGVHLPDRNRHAYFYYRCSCFVLIYPRCPTVHPLSLVHSVQARPIPAPVHANVADHRHLRLRSPSPLMNLCQEKKREREGCVVNKNVIYLLNANAYKKIS